MLLVVRLVGWVYQTSKMSDTCKMDTRIWDRRASFAPSVNETNAKTLPISDVRQRTIQRGWQRSSAFTKKKREQKTNTQTNALHTPMPATRRASHYECPPGVLSSQYLSSLNSAKNAGLIRTRSFPMMARIATSVCWDTE